MAGNCKMNSQASYKISSYVGGALPDCSSLATMIAGRPVGIAVTAGNSYWQLYAGGILTECGTATNVDHAVLAVGVVQNGTDNYWKIKNSWGTSWGE